MTTGLIERYHIWSGRAIKIDVNGDYPANVLSNMSDNAFLFDGMACGSMEGLLQSFHEPDPVLQRRICIMRGNTARNLAQARLVGRDPNRLWWKGKEISPDGPEFQRIIDRAFHAMFVQNDDFSMALLATTGKKLYHTKDPKQKLALLSPTRFIEILCDVRDNAHEFMQEVYKRKDKFLNFAAKKLVDDAIIKISNVIDIAGYEQPIAVSIDADPEAFSTVFTFSIRVTPTLLKFKKDGGDKGMWLAEVDVSNGVNKYECPLGFGRLDKILFRLKADGCVDHVRLALVDGLNSPYLFPE